jgi:hypothetical protein
LAVRQHGYDLGPPWFGDGAEDIRRLRGSRHEVNIFPFRNISIKTSRNFYGDSLTGAQSGPAGVRFRSLRQTGTGEGVGRLVPTNAPAYRDTPLPNCGAWPTYGY